MKKVLIITYHFPPFRTGGVYRHLKFAKYLEKFGWQPYILTVKNPGKRVKDYTLMEDVPKDINVYRTSTLELEGRQKGFIAAKIARKLLKNTILIPDDKIGWLPYAYRKAISIIEKENIDIVCTTSPPHSTQLVGYLLKKRLNCKWVADFRDPWTQSFVKRKLFRNHKIRYLVERWMEQKIVFAADRVVFVTDGEKRRYAEIYPQIDDRKLEVITNGFDENDFLNNLDRASENNQDKFIITFVGRVYPGKSQAFLESLKNLTDSKPDFNKDAIVRFIGHPSNETVNLISKLGLNGLIQFEGFKNHDRVIADMISSDLLILLLGDEKAWIPGKLFEYLRSRRPILVIGVHGDAAEIAIKSGLGTVASNGNVKDIEHRIYEYYLHKRNEQLVIEPNDKFIAKFDRKALTGEFADLLSKTVEHYNLGKL